MTEHAGLMCLLAVAVAVVGVAGWWVFQATMP